MGGSLSKVIKQIRATITCSQLGLREAIFVRDDFALGRDCVPVTDICPQVCGQLRALGRYVRKKRQIQIFSRVRRGISGIFECKSMMLHGVVSDTRCV